MTKLFAMITYNENNNPCNKQNCFDTIEQAETWVVSIITEHKRINTNTYTDYKLHIGEFSEIYEIRLGLIKKLIEGTSKLPVAPEQHHSVEI
jgi:hypothetical protein